jgi:hypothetical protein
VRGRLNSWLLVLVGICALSLWLGKDLVQKGNSVSSESSSTPVATVDFAMPQEETPTHLVVLNGTSEPGLAREFGLRLGRAGCVVESVGNANRRDLARSLLVNRRLTDRQADELARRMGGIRVIREWDGRVGEDAVLVLGADHEHLKTSLANLRNDRGN